MNVKIFLTTVMMGLALSACSKKAEQPAGLKDAFKDKFYFGAAINLTQISGEDPEAIELLKTQFNAIVAENCMKSMFLQPDEDKFYFDDADRFVALGEANNMYITGHTLIWHSQAPDWFFSDSEGNDVSREVMIERMRKHITTVVQRYKGRVKGWDVVNEAILDDGSWRNSKFYRIVGEDFVKLAFRFAHEADPDAELYYNDYSMANHGRRNSVIALVKSIRDEGLRIDGIGMQGHMSMEYPSVEEFEKSLIAFSELGVKVMITELDLSVLPNPRQDVGADVATSVEYRQEMNPYVDGLPPDVEQAWENRYMDFFRLFIKHSDKIARVTTWGISDADSWKNNWPMPGRTDYPLLFDRNHQPKPIVEKLLEAVKE
ncbi:MAG: endo-1,4-beta-xylanase [Prevotellaceae bacterium]|jgi:endo-1,4-beta-xylanase|nr:endo-1,4-beta-xylanase [Prevotellaceae bacterium]